MRCGGPAHARTRRSYCGVTDGCRGEARLGPRIVIPALDDDGPWIRMRARQRAAHVGRPVPTVFSSRPSPDMLVYQRRRYFNCGGDSHRRRSPPATGQAWDRG